jgi:two-component system LytT family sensor kinase
MSWALAAVPAAAAVASGAALFLGGLAAGFAAARRPGRPGDVGTPVEQATFRTLHTASSAAPPLRAGLTPDTARKAARRLRPLLGTPALCLIGLEDVLAWDGAGEQEHRHEVMTQAVQVLGSGRGRTVPARCGEPGCRLRWTVIAPLTVDGEVVGALGVYGVRESQVLVRATEEVARWISVQLELAELDRSRTLLIEAEIRALRAQISPHFVFNSLATISSFVRTDPERARELLLEFADFIRYSFRRHGEFTTLSEELRAIEQYLTLAGARFGDRLAVTLQIAPEVLPVALPFLCLQPLVENAVKHGMTGPAAAACRVSITARDAGAEAWVVIEDDGVGMDPDRLRGILGGRAGSSSGIGLANVDERLRQVYGDEHGLVIETGVGAGTKITVRIPKYRRGVHV